MAWGRNASVTTISSNPCCFRRRTMCSIIGRLARGSIGLGEFDVSGRRRVPSPPAMITAFMLKPSCCGRIYPAFPEGSTSDGNVGDRRVPGEDEGGNGAAPGQELGRVVENEAVVVADQEQREGEHQTERACLARPP